MSIQLHGWTDLIIPTQAMLDLTSREYKLFCYLVFRARGKHSTFPGIERIAADLSLPDDKWSQPTTKRTLSSLQDKAYIIRERRPNKTSITHVFKSPAACREYAGRIMGDLMVGSPMISPSDHARSDIKRIKNKENTVKNKPQPPNPPALAEATGEGEGQAAVKARLSQWGISTAQKLSTDEWVTLDRVNAWITIMEADKRTPIEDLRGRLAVRLRDHAEPPMVAQARSDPDYFRSSIYAAEIDGLRDDDPEPEPYVPPAPPPPHNPNAPRPPHLIWQAAYGQLEVQIPRETFDTWLRDCCLLAYEDGTYVLGVANTYAVEWLTERLQKIIASTLTHLAGRTCEVQFVVYQRGKS